MLHCDAKVVVLSQRKNDTMKLNEAITAARIQSEAGITTEVFHDPLGREDWETEEEAYGYAPTLGAKILAPHRTTIKTFHAVRGLKS